MINVKKISIIIVLALGWCSTLFLSPAQANVNPLSISVESVLAPLTIGSVVINATLSSS